MPCIGGKACLTLPPMSIIQDLGGVPEISRALSIKPPSVYGWGGRIPPERCPDLERWKQGAITCEQMRPDVRWQRVPDPAWPHPQGRPCIDVASSVEGA